MPTPSHGEGQFSLTAAIRAARPPKAPVDPWRPYAFLVEPEHAANGCVEEVATLFLTNRECPFTCLYCDLWKQTTDERVPVGAIPAQIAYALSQLGLEREGCHPVRTIKLYNSGNFFDPQAIPPEDYPAIAALLRPFDTVIVESHPKLCGERVLEFRSLLPATTTLEVALGLETAHPQILQRLNKQMTAEDFSAAARWLDASGIAVRTFILLKPPYMREEECVDWAVRSLVLAFDSGARCCTVIPTRAGNGVMDQLQLAGDFSPPPLSALEAVLTAGLELHRGRVFVDLWDVEQLFPADGSGPARAKRLQAMNLSQLLMTRAGIV